VAQNAFFPLLRYVDSWQPFRTAKTRGQLKERPIRYAGRRDAYIYAYYRKLLSVRYEAELLKLGISSCPIAYRKIPVSAGSSSGKCNIHFAKEAFDAVSELGNCAVVALDISKFFENIDHHKLKKIWIRMLGGGELPPDHFAVFKSVTKYSFVERDEVYKRLGIIVEKEINGKVANFYTVPFDKMPMQLCSLVEFREKIAGYGSVYSSLIQKNKNDFGIPQGTPISDLLANMYLIDFDVEMERYARERGGVYFRYSDDIILIIPGSDSEGIAAEKFAQDKIGESGKRLLIKSEKTSMVVFEVNGDGLSYSIPPGYQNKNGLEYLGFRFDGRYIYLRDSTMANLYRKISKVLYHESLALVKRYRDKSPADIKKIFDLDAVRSRFSRVEDFEKYADSKRSWTFWTYARRAAEIMGKKGDKIPQQLKNGRVNFDHMFEEKLNAAYARANKK
jgi:hypothetical protein